MSLAKRTASVGLLGALGCALQLAFYAGVIWLIVWFLRYLEVIS